MIKACDSPIGQPEKKTKILFQKKHEGAEYSTYFQNVFEKLCFICEIFFIFLKYFIVCLFGFFFLIFLKVTRENNITLIWRFIHVHLFVFKWLKFNFYVGISDNIYIFFLILDVTISWEKMQINFKILEKC